MGECWEKRTSWRLISECLLPASLAIFLLILPNLCEGDIFPIYHRTLKLKKVKSLNQVHTTQWVTELEFDSMSVWLWGNKSPSKLVCSFFNGNKVFISGSLPCSCQEPNTKCLEVQIYLTFNFSSYKIEILLHHSLCVLVVIVGKTLMMITATEDTTTNGWPHLGLEAPVSTC